VRSVLADLPPAGTLILRDISDNYSFAHPSLVDFYVAQRIFVDLAGGNSDLLATTQTSHDTDHVIRRFVQHKNSCLPILTQWMQGREYASAQGQQRGYALQETLRNEQCRETCEL
jgi:hypothetical protein